MIYGEKNYDRPIRLGMIGGGKGAQIGYIHRSAALRDFNFDLVAGAFDVDYERGVSFGEQLHVAKERCYRDYKEMFSAEKERNDGIEAVIVATPNHLHFEMTKAALENHLHVICEKPVSFTIEEAQELKDLSEKQKKIIGVTYGYSGHQLIEQARQMVKNGDLGDIRIIQMSFAHGFHAQAVENENASTKWRVTPEYAGSSYVLGDIGTHPLYLSEVICPDLKITRLLCERQSFVKSRAPLEDNALTIHKYDNGAVGYVWSSSVNCGWMHGHKIRVIGEKASIEWWDVHPNQLTYEVQGEPVQILERGMDYLYESARKEDRIGAGHAEGLFEAWSNLYTRFGTAMRKIDQGERYEGWYPDINAGLEGVRWINNCVKSAEAGATWVEYQ